MRCPAYEMVLKCAHTFNLLDARGAISVTERAGYIGRIRDACAHGGAGLFRVARDSSDFPMLQRARERAHERRTLLVELLHRGTAAEGAEALGNAFAQGIVEGLKQAPCSKRSRDYRAFATPRRLAVVIQDVRAKAPDKTRSRKAACRFPSRIDADGATARPAAAPRNSLP